MSCNCCCLCCTRVPTVGVWHVMPYCEAGHLVLNCVCQLHLFVAICSFQCRSQGDGLQRSCRLISLKYRTAPSLCECCALLDSYTELYSAGINCAQHGRLLFHPADTMLERVVIRTVQVIKLQKPGTVRNYMLLLPRAAQPDPWLYLPSSVCCKLHSRPHVFRTRACLAMNTQPL